MKIVGIALIVLASYLALDDFVKAVPFALVGIWFVAVEMELKERKR